MPKQVCFARRCQCNDTAEATIRLRETYIAAAHTGKMSMHERMFTMRMGQNPAVLDLMCCIPVDNDFDGSERMDFAQCKALCIYYRGPYEGTAEAIKALENHIKENNIEVAGEFRSIYLEGPPNRGEKSEDYITQVAVPIKSLL